MHNSSTSFSRSRCECSWCVRNICKYIYIYLCIYFLLVFAHWLCVVIEFIRLFFSLLVSSRVSLRFFYFCTVLCIDSNTRRKTHKYTHIYTETRHREHSETESKRESTKHRDTLAHAHTHRETRHEIALPFLLLLLLLLLLCVVFLLF